jgi:hypothetical protein
VPELSLSKSELQKLRNKLQQSRRDLDVNELWLDLSAKKRVFVSIDNAVAAIAKKISSFGVRSLR